MAAGLLLSSLAATSCKKDDATTEETTTPVVAKKPLYATLGGNAFTAGTASGTLNGSSIVVSGITGTKILSLTVPSTATAGTTYNIGGANTMSYTPNGGSTMYAATSGSITVTKHDAANDKIEGTFSGVLTNTGGSGTIAVASGEFNVTY